MHCGDAAAAAAAAHGAERAGRESVAQRRERGREELARRTGSRATARSAAAQLLRVVQADERREGAAGMSGGVLGGTDRIVLEGGLLASVFLGRCVGLPLARRRRKLRRPGAMQWVDD